MYAGEGLELRYLEIKYQTTPGLHLWGSVGKKFTPVLSTVKGPNGQCSGSGSRLERGHLETESQVFLALCETDLPSAGNVLYALGPGNS